MTAAADPSRLVQDELLGYRRYSNSIKCFRNESLALAWPAWLPAYGAAWPRASPILDIPLATQGTVLRSPRHQTPARRRRSQSTACAASRSGSFSKLQCVTAYRVGEEGSSFVGHQVPVVARAPVCVGLATIPPRIGAGACRC